MTIQMDNDDVIQDRNDVVEPQYLIPFYTITSMKDSDAYRILRYFPDSIEC
jgi:hypothetical protein